MWKVIWLWCLFQNVYIYQNIRFYTLNHIRTIAANQLYSNKGKRKNKYSHSRQTSFWTLPDPSQGPSWTLRTVIFLISKGEREIIPDCDGGKAPGAPRLPNTLPNKTAAGPDSGGQNSPVHVTGEQFCFLMVPDTVPGPELIKSLLKWQLPFIKLFPCAKLWVVLFTCVRICGVAQSIFTYRWKTRLSTPLAASILLLLSYSFQSYTISTKQI